MANPSKETQGTGARGAAGEPAGREQIRDPIDADGMASFPASDPPSHWAGAQGSGADAPREERPGEHVRPA